VNGLELSERYFEEYGPSLLEGTLQACKDRIAAGLVGEGSECFGFDDELSRDHDWGPGFCLWLTEADYAEVGSDLQARYDALPGDFAGFERRAEGPHAGKRTGVFTIKDFYSRFIRYGHVPTTLGEWRSLPETYLATATNGKVFADPLGEFTAFRKGLLGFYPEDVRLKKLAARCFAAGQAGQYNYARCVIRGESVAAHCALGLFMEAVVSIVYLLNKRYRPFYKWMHRGMEVLPVLGRQVHGLLAALCEGQDGGPGAGSEQAVMEHISAQIVAELVSEGLSDAQSDFLMDHAHAIQAKIRDQALKDLHVMLE
jgi:hypothetical protein